MFFSIDTNSDVAVYEQIVRQVQFAIADGTLVGGQMLPSVRQLSREITLNPNTVARAYRELQERNILEPLRGRGMVVRRDAVDACRQSRDQIVQDELASAIDNALAGGMTAKELQDLFSQQLQMRHPNNSRK